MARFVIVPVMLRIPFMKSHVTKPVVAVGLGVGVWAALLACFRPDAETRGAEDGARAGIRVWCRMMGRRTSEG